MAKILIVEDDTDINNMLLDALVGSGYECRQAFSGTEALLYIRNEGFSVIILDLMLPGLNGEEVLKQAKMIADTPIIILSSKDELATKVDLLALGADDYMTKPFEIKELLVRIIVQLRKLPGNAIGVDNKIIKHKDLTLDKEKYTLIINENCINLTKHEFKIMELLMLHPEKVYSKNDIYEYAWEDMYMGEDKTVNVHISNIRQKIKKFSNKEYIDTVWGIGFKLSE